MQHTWLAFQRADGLFRLDVDNGASTIPLPLIVELGSTRAYPFGMSATGRQIALVTPPPGELFVADANCTIAKLVGARGWL